MNTLNIRRFGLAFGLTGALLYIGCILLMIVLGRTGSILFFNNLLHGLDISTITIMNIPVWQTALGLIETLVISWLIGMSIAFIYNVTAKIKP